MRNIKQLVKLKLIRLGFDTLSSEYLSESVKYCITHRIHALDINLNSVIYPHLAKKHNKHQHTIERELMRSLKEYRENPCNVVDFKNEFGNDRPTVKKIIILLLLNKDKLER